jgi:hypothetical protein
MRVSATGRGSPARRAAAGLIFVAGLAVWAVTATEVGGPGFALTTPHGLWTTLLYWTLLIGLALAASAPMRQAVVAATLPAALAPRCRGTRRSGRTPAHGEEQQPDRRCHSPS